MIGHQVGHYRIVEELGAGAMGVVYRAEDPRLGREVAIKFLAAHASPDESAALIHEARAAAGLTHPNICSIHDVGEHEGRPFMVMEMVVGPTLRELIAAGDLTVDRALELARQVGSGLAAAHQEGIVHGDIKPDNIMVAADGQARIMDFGVARTIGDEGDLSESVGTLAYMAPECLLKGAVGPAQDLWAFGATVYEMLAGRKAFPGAYRPEIEYMITSVDPDPLDSVVPEVPATVAASLAQALSKRVSDRQPTATAIMDTWTAAPERPDEPGMVAAGSSGSRRGLVVLAVVALMAAVLVAWQVTRRGDDTPVPASAVVTMAIADFRGPADGSAPNLGAGMTELLNIGLLESSPVRMTSREYLHDLRRRMFGESEGLLGADEALSVSRRGGVSYLLAGQLTPTGDEDLVTWRLIDVASGANLAANQVRGDNWAELADRIIAGALTALNDHLGADRPTIPVTVADLTTTYPEAYELYIAGLVNQRNLQYEPARQSLEGAVAIDSTFALAHFALSRIYSNVHGGIGDSRLTASHADQAWRHRTRLGHKDRLRVKAWRAQLGYRMAEVREVFAEMLAEWPDDRELLLDQLEFLHYRWYFREGLEVATQAVEYYEDEATILDYQQDMLAAMGESAKALEVVRRLVSLVPDEVSYWQELGSRWLELADPDQAEAAARQSLELDSDYLMGRLQLVQARYARGDLEGAIADMEKIAADTTLGEGQMIMVLTSSSFRPSLTMLYGDAGRVNDAVAAFDRATSLAGSPGTAMAIQGRRHRFLLRVGRVEPALAWSRDILGSSPDNSAWFNAALNGAVAYALADSFAVAQSLVDSLHTRSETIGGLARFMARRGEIVAHLAADRPDSALAVIARVWRDGLMPGGAFELDVRCWEAQALHQAGRLDEAAETLEDLLLVHAGHAPARLHLALILAETGRRTEALRECEAFLAAWAQADPDHETLAAARALRRSLAP